MKRHHKRIKNIKLEKPGPVERNREPRNKTLSVGELFIQWWCRHTEWHRTENHILLLSLPVTAGIMYSCRSRQSKKCNKNHYVLLRHT